MWLYNSSLGRVSCSAASHDPSHNKFSVTFWILCPYMKMYVSFRSSVLASLISHPSLPPSLNRSPSVSSVLLSILRLSSGHFFLRLPPLVLPPPSTLSFPLSLSLSLVDLAPVSFPLVHPSVCHLFWGVGGTNLFSNLSLIYAWRGSMHGS